MLEVEARWAAGDARSFTLTKTLEDSSRPERNSTSTTPVEVRVLEAGPTGSRLEWQTGKTVVELDSSQVGSDAAKVAGEVLDKFTELAQLTIEYTTDELGSLLELENRDEVARQMERIFEQLVDLRGSIPPDAEDKARTLLLSDTYIDTVALEDPLVFHGGYGVEVDPERASTSPMELPNPFGGPAIPATTSVELVTPRDADGCAVFGIVVTPEADEAFRIVAEAAGIDVDAASAEELRGLEMRNTVRYVYDPSSGWMVRVEIEKVIRLPGASRVDRRVIEAV